ncbi:MAG TPA: hypothetical protein VE619_04825, partial [Nitrososphaeraceae archaeon]|nr:hypothetical protein [Nitrososphaeraceae archaeon]
MGILGRDRKNVCIAVCLITTVLLSVILVASNNALVSLMAYGDNTDKDNNSIKNRSQINDISDRVVSSNADIDKQQVQQVLNILQTQIALTSGQDKATKAINQVNLMIRLNPNGPLAQSLLFLAKEQASGNRDAIIQAAIKTAAHISNGEDDLGQSLVQDIVKSSPEIQFTNSSLQSSPSSDLSKLTGSSSFSGQKSLITADGTDIARTTIIRSNSDKSKMEGIGQESDTDENEANTLSREGTWSIATFSNNKLPDYTLFQSNKCDGSLDKYVPNPFVQRINS